MWAARGVEFFPIKGRDWGDMRYYHPFESRFAKAAQNAGFGTETSMGLAGALREMADNVAQHSGSDSSNPAPGLIGYYICDSHVAFAVGDAGRGSLASLRQNPSWQCLTNSKEALMAIIQKHASRRQFAGDGEGFKEVFRSLINLNGLIELRSRDGRVRVVQHPSGTRQAEPQFSGDVPGFQLSVNCSLAGCPREEIFCIDFLT